jgi:hypothetical protein
MDRNLRTTPSWSGRFDSLLLSLSLPRRSRAKAGVLAARGRAERQRLRYYRGLVDSVADSFLGLPRGLALRNRTTPGMREASNLGRDALVDAGVIGEDARITINRTSKEDVGFREVFVSLDGEELTILRHGETFTTEVKAGPHRIRAHNTLFWKSYDLVLKPGEHARFDAINRAGWGTFGMLIMLGATPVYLTFERVRENQPARASRS